MCTVTFSPRKRGYALAMNRDEKLTRASGLPPVASVLHGRRVLAPSEPSGGTWISVNDSGASFALINWYSIPSRATPKSISRGDVVKNIGPLSTAHSVARTMEQLPLARMNPFRLIGFFPETNQVFEWRWNLETLFAKQHPWHLQQWISSGFDEPQAQRMRGKIFQAATKQKAGGSLEWLRRLHRSHAPDIGPFSTCMHRADAATVSYTEVSVSSRRCVMQYFGESLCRCARGQLQVCELNLI